MNVCVVAEYYPRRRDPVLGVWAHRQAVAAAEAGVDIRVLALERPIPPAALLREARQGRPRPLVRALAAIARQPRRDVIDGLDVEYVRFVAPPREHAYASWERWARRPLTRALEHLRARWSIDLVHAHYALPAGGAARAFCLRRRVPLVVSVHGGDLLGEAVEQAPARQRIGQVLAGSAGVLCNSRATLEGAAALAGTSGHMRVVHLGATPPASPAHRRTERTVATLAHLVARKRHGDVLRAVRLLAPTLPDLRLLVIGDGPERAPLAALAERLGVAERVEWAGQLAPDEALRRLAGCHLMAMPSVDEAYGVAYVEALACGVPALGCRGEGGPEEIAALGEGMLLVPPADVEALAGAIREALEHPRRHQELSRAARATARAHFTWEGCGQATRRAYEDALAEPRAGRPAARVGAAAGQNA